ncbi:enoyl-CoA hydratase/isomerase family protein [Salinibacillus xinjiangensis]|uniref:Enoyl-CoA hydratase/isomerase family protein n=1 Tax=Salinibacillus xinjiangensis TaxID=1229268 RepID=A0A6G1X3I5_9BACI|nr:enoyl-CoA hydratase/isomerase family protein [Salinibacillus xinjiangensis]MRG85507.1 enoyl-CoA hydratase/isomerase family protein [Salinibacillus xinjiangensis]
MYKTILVDHDLKHGFITITLNRPQKRNAVSLELASELNQALDLAQQENGLKFLVITGTGFKAFCSGGDLYDFHGDMDEEESYQVLNRMKEVLFKLATFPLPTICILNGDARGGGCELATACDFRFAKSGTKHGFVQGKLGIIPGWGGGVLLHKKIEHSLAYYWLVTSDIFEVETLQQWGWAQAIYHDEIEVEQLLTPFIQKHPEQLEILKSQHVHQSSYQDLYEEMNQEVRQCARLWPSEEHKKAVKAFFNTRKNK